MTRPDPSLLEGVVAPRVIEAMKAASAALVKAGVRHVVVGGLAVGANGYPRASTDVHLLVGREAFEEHPGGLVTLKAGVPFQVNSVPIDFISVRSDEQFLETALAAPPGSFVEAPPLVYLKLRSSRLRHQTRCTAEAKVLKGMSEGIDAAAEAAVKQWKFRPGTRNGKPVSVISNVIVNIRPRRAA